MLQTEGATDRARGRYKRGGEEKKGGRERPTEWVGRINGRRVTIGRGGGCRVWRGATDTMDGRDKRGIEWL